MMNGNDGGVALQREFLLISQLELEIQKLERKLRLQEVQTQRLSIRYSKRMVLIANVILGTMTFFSQFSIWMRTNGRRSKSLLISSSSPAGAFSLSNWTPGALLRRLIAYSLPDRAKPQSVLAASLLSSGISAWEHSWWFLLATWLIWLEPWASVEGESTTLSAWYAVIGLHGWDQEEEDASVSQRELAVESIESPPITSDMKFSLIKQQSISTSETSNLPHPKTSHVSNISSKHRPAHSFSTHHVSHAAPAETIFDVEFEAEREEEAIALAKWKRSLEAASVLKPSSSATGTSAMSPRPKVSSITSQPSSPVRLLQSPNHSQPTTSSPPSALSNSESAQSRSSSLLSLAHFTSSPLQSQSSQISSELSHDNSLVTDTSHSSSIENAASDSPEHLASPPSPSLSHRVLRLWRLARVALRYLRPGVVGSLTSLGASAVLVFRRGAPQRWAHYVSMFFLMCYLSLRYASPDSALAMLFSKQG